MTTPDPRRAPVADSDTDAPGTGGLYVGVDGGGTRTRVLVTDAAGRELARADGPGSLVDPLRPEASARVVEEVVRAALRELGLAGPVDGLWAGLAGAGRELARREVERALAATRVATRLRVGTDIEVAFDDAFGAGAGLLLVGGTGSVALGRAPDGRIARVGGWGDRLGDEGSAWGVGLDALRAVARATDGRGPGSSLERVVVEALGLDAPEELIPWVAAASKGEVAALAPLVVREAAAGDAVARGVVDRAVAALAEHVMALKDALGPWPSPPTVAMTGGLVQPGGPLRNAVETALDGLEVEVSEIVPDPARGAARRAVGL